MIRDAPEPMPNLDDTALLLERVVDRLRTLGESRLIRHDVAFGFSVAEAVHRCVTVWAVMVHGVDGPVPPRLSAIASGDQLAVIGAELMAAWREGRLSPAQQRTVADGIGELRRMV